MAIINKKSNYIYVIILTSLLFSAAWAKKKIAPYTMPAEWEPQESIWLQWPHDETYLGYLNAEEVEHIWVDIVKALIDYQKINIISIDENKQDHLKILLKDIDNGNIIYHIAKINDVWIRDNGPVYVKNNNSENVIMDWQFNGWGDKVPSQYYKDDDVIPSTIGNALSIEVVNPPIVLEGGAIEVNGKSTFMGTRSSIINDNRNPGMTQEDIENILSEYLGVTHFIWLEGPLYDDPEIGGDITDGHVDGLARFVDDTTVLYSWCEEDENNPWFRRILKKNLEILKSSVTESGKKIRLIPLLETDGPVDDYPASYCNFLITNKVVLVPVYGDANDAPALKIIEDLFPNHKIEGINCTDIYKYGGMIHCITQQEPSGITPVKYQPEYNQKICSDISIKTFPSGQIVMHLKNADTYLITLYTGNGKKLFQVANQFFSKGKHKIKLDKKLPVSGTFFLRIKGTNEETSVPVKIYH